MVFKNGLENKRILVLGDVMLDRYVYGTIERISPEAPVPVFLQEHESDTVGGAANVALNLTSLSSSTPGLRVGLFGAAGRDTAGKNMQRILSNQGIEDYVHYFGDRSTICKTRFVAQRNHQVMRVDKELDSWDHLDLTAELEDCLMSFQPHLVVVSDYAKGVVWLDVMKLLAQHQKPVMLDPKPENIDAYRPEGLPFSNIILIKPNQRETTEMFSEIAGKNRKSKNMRECVAFLSAHYATDLVVTLGSKGMMWFDVKSGEGGGVHALAQEVYDVSGAGDTVMAVLALSTLCGLDLPKSCELANRAAAYVVSKPGTTVAPAELFD